jgi:hypothetical protein
MGGGLVRVNVARSGGRTIASTATGFARRPFTMGLISPRAIPRSSVAFMIS